MFKKVTLRVIKAMWVLFASSVVLLAVLITALKYSLSYVNDYKSDIESYLLNTIGANVEIGRINTSWQSTGPVVILSNVTLEASKQAPLDITIGTTHVEIDFWQSLLQQKFVSESFLLNGIEAQINSEVFYRVRPSSEGSQLFESLSQLFLSQLNTFKIENSLIRVRHKNGRTQNYFLESLQWLNDGNRHQAAGNIYVDGFSRNSIALVLDLYGQHRRNIFGQIYLEAQQVDVSPWLEQLISEHVEISSSHVNFSAWGSINNGLVEDIVIDINDSYIHWGEEPENKRLGVKSAQLQWQKKQDDWLMFGNDIVLGSNDVEYDGFNFTFRSQNKFKQLDLNRFNLASVESLFSLFSATKNSKSLATAELDGLVENIQVHWDEEQKPYAYAEIRQFGFLPEHKEGSAYLGIENTGLELFWHNGTGLAKLRGSDGKLATKDTFSKTIAYQTLELDVLFSQYEEVFSVAVPKLKFINEDIQVNLASQYLDQAESVPDYLAIYGEVQGPRQGQIHHYLPKYLLSDDAYQYLNDAIQQGRGELTQILISGDPADLFNKQLAKFEIRAQLRDSLFRFSESWPAIENFNSELVVDSRLMS
ncbi:MAG: hypothetical protein HWE10_07520, partial [Gammaproteobacteria bacterium]|nr:hypothetical protein [Gammaproteobacteria bacterium]